MKRKILFLGLLVGWLVPASMVFGQTDLIDHPSCPLCGMDRKEYSHTRMVIEYVEGMSRGTCSIHCTASEMTINRDKTLNSIQVADYITKTLLPVEKAF